MELIQNINTLINLVLAVFTLGTLIIAILTFRQAKSFEKERTRPIMQAHLRIAEDFDKSLDLIISNVGQTVAHNVSFEFIPPLPETPLEELNKTSSSTIFYEHPLKIIRERFLEESILTWVPGYETSAMFWISKEDGSRTSIEGLPDRLKIKITYTDNQGKSTKYCDTFELNAALLFGTREPKTSLYKIQKDLQEIHRELRSIREGKKYPQANVNRAY